MALRTLAARRILNVVGGEGEFVMPGRSTNYRLLSAVALAPLAAVSASAAPSALIDTKTSAPVAGVTREQLEKLPAGRRIEDLVGTCPSTAIPTISRQPDVLIDGKPLVDLNCVQPADIEMVEVYRVHNAARAEYGAPALAWDPALVLSAGTVARERARTGTLEHSSRAGRGTVRENISQGLPWWSTRQLMANWEKEKKNFVPGIFPNVSRTHNWYDIGHWAQMIWIQTVLIGCAKAVGGASAWLVCHYDPGGNKDGHAVGIPVQPQQVASAPGRAIQPRLIGGDNTGGTTQSAANRNDAGKTDGQPPKAVRYQWIDVKTGAPVASWPSIGGRVIRGTDSNQVFDPETGRNFARDESGNWIDIKTGVRVADWPSIEGRVIRGTDSNQVFDPETGRNFAREPIPPKSASAPSAPHAAASDSSIGSGPTGGNYTGGSTHPVASTHYQPQGDFAVGRQRAGLDVNVCSGLNQHNCQGPGGDVDLNASTNVILDSLFDLGIDAGGARTSDWFDGDHALGTNNNEYWGASAGLIAALADDLSSEIGAAYYDFDFTGGGGIYWDPFNQVTIGAGATYVDTLPATGPGVSSNPAKCAVSQWLNAYRWAEDNYDDAQARGDLGAMMVAKAEMANAILGQFRAWEAAGEAGEFANASASELGSSLSKMISVYTSMTGEPAPVQFTEETGFQLSDGAAKPSGATIEQPKLPTTEVFKPAEMPNCPMDVM